MSIVFSVQYRVNGSSKMEVDFIIGLFVISIYFSYQSYSIIMESSCSSFFYHLFLKSENMDRFWSYRCLHDHIDLPNNMEAVLISGMLDIKDRPWGYRDNFYMTLKFDEVMKKPQKQSDSNSCFCYRDRSDKYGALFSKMWVGLA